MYLLTTAALVVTGWVVVFVSSRREIAGTRAELRIEFQQQLSALWTRIRVLEQGTGTQAAGAGSSANAGSAKTAGIVGELVAPTSHESRPAEEITPETLAKISETITALLGRKVRMLSVKVLPSPSAGANPWAQQGRVIVQASHNLGQRGRE
jgi:hypothetical protein